MNHVTRDDVLTLLEGVPHDAFYISMNPIIHSSIYMQVNRAGIVCKTPRDFHITRKNGYNYTVIHCAFRGAGYLSVRGRLHSIKAGTCFLLTSQEPHEYWADPDDPWELAWVEFGGGISAQMSRYILDRGGPVFSGKVFTREIELCTSVLSQQDIQLPKISSILYEMLMTMCSKVEEAAGQDSTRQSILAYIDDHLHTRLSLETIAKQFGYNPSYFSAMFSRSMGVSFSKYVQLHRISRACVLLITTDWSLDNISQELGYYDTSHFIHAFKQVEGITPSAYRKESNYAVKTAQATSHITD